MKKIEGWVVFEDFPEYRDVHVFKDGFVMVHESQIGFPLDLKHIVCPI
jgi:hypothetical protein